MHFSITMTNKKNADSRTVQHSNRLVVVRGKIDTGTPSTHYT